MQRQEEVTVEDLGVVGPCKVVYQKGSDSANYTIRINPSTTFNHRMTLRELDELCGKLQTLAAEVRKDSK